MLIYDIKNWPYIYIFIFQTVKVQTDGCVFPVSWEVSRQRDHGGTEEQTCVTETVEWLS